MSGLRSTSFLKASLEPNPWPALSANCSQRGSPPSKAAICEIAKRVIFLTNNPDPNIENVHFGDAAWLVLLTLFLAKNYGHHVSIKELRKLRSIPATNAQRIVNYLEQSGHIRRVKDIADGRRFNLLLEETAEASIERQLNLLNGTTGI